MRKMIHKILNAFCLVILIIWWAVCLPFSLVEMIVMTPLYALLTDGRNYSEMWMRMTNYGCLFSLCGTWPVSSFIDRKRDGR